MINIKIIKEAENKKKKLVLIYLSKKINKKMKMMNMKKINLIKNYKANKIQIRLKVRNIKKYLTLYLKIGSFRVPKR